MSALLTLLLCSAPPPPLTIEAAVERALSVAPELAAQNKASEAADAQIGEARSSWWPRLSLEANYLLRVPKNELPISFPMIPMIPTPEIPDVDDVHHFQGGVKLAYRAFDLSRGPSIEAAEAKAEAAKLTLEDAAAKLAFRVRATYLAALLARDLQKIAATSLEVAREEERKASLAAEVGSGTRVALAQTRVRVAGLEAQERRAASELDRHRASLALLLQLEELPPLEGDLEELAGPAPSGTAEKHPEVQALLASRSAAESAARAKSRTFWPTLSAQASVELHYPRGLIAELGPVFQAGVLFNWPLFDGFARESAAEAQDALAAQLGELSEAKRQEIDRKLVELRARRASAEADLAGAKKTQAETEIYLRVAKAALEAGTGTQLDVHNAELGIDQTKTAVRRALFDLAAVRAESLLVYGVAGERKQ